MYNSRPNLMIGFHGCDKDICDNLVMNPQSIKSSQEVYDWLGHGFYVWENNIERARLWAKEKFDRGDIKNPSVVGVVYQLNHCLDFTDSAYTKLIGTYYKLMRDNFHEIGKELPVNNDHPKDKHQDKVLRELDCAVIQYMHSEITQKIEEDKAEFGFSELRHFDTVRGLFTEGGPAFEGAGIQLKNHIQICIRNLNCIKGFFIPRQLVKFP
jgi:hypothetical protein